MRTQSPPKFALHAERRQTAPVGQRPTQIDARRQFALACQLLIETKQPPARGRSAAVHVLHTGDADLPRLGERGADGVDDFVLGRLRDVARDECHRIVAQHAAGLTRAGLAINDAAGRIGRFRA